MVIHTNQSQRSPGELQGFEVHCGSSSSLTFNRRLFPHALRRASSPGEHTHGLEGQTVEYLNSAIIEGQSQA